MSVFITCSERIVCEPTETKTLHNGVVSVRYDKINVRYGKLSINITTICINDLGKRLQSISREQSENK